MNNDQFELVKEKGIPVEVCPSSNKATMGLSVVSHIKSIPYLYRCGAKIIPCCDDTMLFNTNMINETFELVNMLNLSEVDIKNLILDAADAIFDTELQQTLKDDISKVKAEGEESKVEEIE
jgi:adenosine deaminase